MFTREDIHAVVFDVVLIGQDEEINRSIEFFQLSSCLFVVICLLVALEKFCLNR